MRTRAFSPNLARKTCCGPGILRNRLLLLLACLLCQWDSHTLLTASVAAPETPHRIAYLKTSDIIAHRDHKTCVLMTDCNGILWRFFRSMAPEEHLTGPLVSRDVSISISDHDVPCLSGTEWHISS